VAAVTVFVDRAVKGEFPLVCVKTGRPAEGLVKIYEAVGGLGAGAWVLVLLGPLGWIALVILSTLGTGRELLAVQLPYSHEVWARYTPRQRVRFAGGTVGVGAAFAALAGFAPGRPFWVALAVVGLLAAVVAHVKLAFDDVDISLDASRRWVTLSGVHQTFADAVQAMDRNVTG
jgi:hypothetical protein